MQRSPILYPTLIFFAGLIVYANSLGNGFTFDDQAIVVGNPAVRALDPVRVFSSSYWPDRPELGLYRPLTTLTYALNYALHGLSPRGYHVFNLLLHLLNGALVFWIALRVLGHAPSAAAAALAFVLHPVQTEAVNGVVGRAELLSAFWVLLAWALYLGAWRGRHRLYAASLVAALLGCLSKENAVVLVGILAAGDYLFFLRGNAPGGFREFVRRDGPRYVPYVLVVLLFLVVRYAVLGTVLLPGRPLLIDNLLAHLPAGERLLTAVAVMGRYIGLLVLPLRLSADYSYSQIQAVGSPFHPGFLVMVPVLAVMALAIYQGVRRLWAPEWGFGTALFVVAFLPVSNLLFPIGTVMGERLLYLPSVGFCLLLGMAYRSMGRWGGLRWAAPVSACLLLGACGVRTYLRNPDWKDNEALFSSAVRAAPRSAKAHHNLGSALRDRGDLEGALREYGEALRIYPEYAEAHYNIGTVFQGAGAIDRAREAYGRALAADSLHVSAWINLGTLLGREGLYLDSREALARALKLDPDNLAAQYNYALACQKLGQGAEAVSAYLRVLEVDPGYVDAAINLGSLYMDMGYDAETIAVYRRLLKVRPNAFRVAYNLGVILERMERPEEAAAAYEQASRSQDEMGGFSLFRAGSLYRKMKRAEDARRALGAFLKRWEGDPKYRRAAERLLSELSVDHEMR